MACWVGAWAFVFRVWSVFYLWTAFFSSPAQTESNYGSVVHKLPQLSWHIPALEAGLSPLLQCFLFSNAVFEMSCTVSYIMAA